MVGGGGMMDLLEKRPHLRATFQNTMDLPPIDPSAISNAVVFLASDESQFITGVTLPVDAGTMAV
jgi:NAD(P)-dependent dehydrogenase (short-subunit alcohol dehydrogenase family)